MTKLSKKITSNIYELVNRIQPGISKNTSYDEAWTIFANYGDIEGSIYTDVKGNTKFDIYDKSEQIVGTLEWSDVYKEDECDWDWTTIYKDVIDYILKKKIIKRPKGVKSVTPKEKTINKKSESVTPDIDQLKRKKQSTYQKIREWKLKGKDVTSLQKEYDEIVKTIKSFK